MLIDTAIVVANGEPPSAQLIRALLKNQNCLIAVDGGLHACLDAGIEPHLLIGDFDSISEAERKKFSHIPQIHTPDQDKSDLEKALLYLFENQVKQIVVCGALGKRLDHTLANMCLLACYPEKVRFETEREICLALQSPCTLASEIGQTVSLIPLSTTVDNVNTTGLKWELKGSTLSKTFISISNVCVDSSITISFASGDLIACLSRSRSFFH